MIGWALIRGEMHTPEGRPIMLTNSGRVIKELLYMNRWSSSCCSAACCFAAAEPPDIEYIYSAGGQRGDRGPCGWVVIGFHGQAGFEMLGPGCSNPPYPAWTPRGSKACPAFSRSPNAAKIIKDHANEITLAANAPLGDRYWRCWTRRAPRARCACRQPTEVMEEEIDGRPLPQAVTLPVTANGRIFHEKTSTSGPRSKAGDVIVCDAAAKPVGSPVNLVLSVQNPTGRPLPTQHTVRGGDPVHWFLAPTTGRYAVSLRDAQFWGLQNHIYRLVPHARSAHPAHVPARCPTWHHCFRRGTWPGPKPRAVSSPFRRRP